MSTIPIILAAGHGGRDTGATSPDRRYKERDQVIYITDLVADALREQDLIVTVAPHGLDTHETIPWLNKRYQWGDGWALELHRDSAPSIMEPSASWRCGIYHGTSTLSKTVAATYLTAAQAAGAHSTSWARSHTQSRHGRLGWIAQPESLSHLLELGFMEGRNSDTHLQALARIATAGILAAAPRKLVPA